MARQTNPAKESLAGKNNHDRMKERKSSCNGQTLTMERRSRIQEIKKEIVVPLVLSVEEHLNEKMSLIREMKLTSSLLID